MTNRWPGGFGVWSDSELLTVTANISGYPGDKPAGTQWYGAGQLVDARLAGLALRIARVPTP